MNAKMASNRQPVKGKKTSGSKPEKTERPTSSQEKKYQTNADLMKKIKKLEADNERLSKENTMFKNKFDLKEILKALTKEGIKEVDLNELAQDMVKLTIREAEEKHSVEKTEMERNHKKEIEKLKQNVQGKDPLSIESGYKDKTDQLNRDLNERDQMPKDLRNQDNSLESVDIDDIKIQLSDIQKENDKIKREKTDLLFEKRKKDEEMQTLHEKIKELDQKNTTLNEALRRLESDKHGLTEQVKKLQKEIGEQNSRKAIVVESSKQDDIQPQLRETTKENDEIVREKAALLTEKQKDTEMQKLQKENKELKQLDEKNKSLKEELTKLERDKHELTKQLENLQKQIGEQNSGNAKVVETSKQDDIQLQLGETTKERDEIKQEKAALLAEKKKNDTEMQKLQNENKELKQLDEKNKSLKEELKKFERDKDELTKQLESLQKQIGEQNSGEKSALLAEKRKKDVEMQKLLEENKQLKQSNEKNNNLNEDLKKMKVEKDNLTQQLNSLQKENDEFKYRLKESQSPSLSNVISANDNKVVQQLQGEIERLRTRLSEMAGAQMTHNNPNIADLSDAFRPTKLSEEYSQLYDNQWTDAFEEQHDDSKKEEDTIEMLLKTLLSTYKFCEKVSKDFTDQLTNSSLALPKSKPSAKNKDIPIVYKKQLQDMKKNFAVLLRDDVKELYGEGNANKGGQKTKNYIDACVDLCWLMVLQEPPVVIETPASSSSTFDSDTYRTYTKTGKKVDFVVWPALRLHEGGPLLTKGVAQGKH